MSATFNYFSSDNFARHVGIELIEQKPGYARGKMEIKDHHLNGIRVVQGGAIYCLAVWTFAVAANAHGAMAVGLNASISYVKSVSKGTLYAEAKEMSLSSKIGTYNVIVTNDKDEVVATFQGMSYRKVDRKKHQTPARV